LHTCLSDSAVVLQSSLFSLVEVRETLNHPSFTSQSMMVCLLISASQRLERQTLSAGQGTGDEDPRAAFSTRRQIFNTPYQQQIGLVRYPATLHTILPCPAAPASRTFLLLQERRSPAGPQRPSGHDRFSFHSAYATLRIFLQSPLEEPLGEMRC
jgi:hypothetical protein